MVKMNIGYICSDEYAKYAGVSMMSLFESNKKVDEINVFIFDKDISDKNKQKISKIVNKYKRKVFFVDGSNELSDVLSNITIDSFRGVQHTYAKIFPFVFAKGVDKILVLDSDTIINQDLTDLYNTDISEYYFAAVPEITAWFRSSEDPAIIYKNKFYFNSGMLLCNLKKINTKKYLTKITKARDAHKSALRLADQSLLNLSMDSDDIIPVNFKYNYNINLNLFNDFRASIQEKYNEFKLGIINDDFNRIIDVKDIAIIHYIGANRPWAVGYNAPYATEWVKFFKKSPWKNDQEIKKIIKKENLFKKCVFYTTEDNCCKKKYLFGIKLQETIIEPGCRKRKYLYGLLRSYTRSDSKKYKLLGVQIYDVKNVAGLKERRIFGVCITSKYKRIKHQLDIISNNLNYVISKENQLPELIYQSQWFPERVAALHQEVFPQFKNINSGRDVVICGCGPTLNIYKPIKNAVHISCNRAFRNKKIKFDYGFIWDLHGFKCANDGAVEDFLNYNFIKFVGKFMYDNVAVQENIENNAGKLYRCYSSARWGLPEIPVVDNVIHTDISLFPLADFMSVSFGALNFASWTNPKRIYLVGLDTVINGSFDGRQNPYNFNDMLRGYKLFKEFMINHYPDTEIISVNPIGLRGMFNDVYTREFLKQHPEIKDAEVLQ